MQLKLSKILVIDIDDENLINWSYEKITGIYTFTFVDGTVWKYESRILRVKSKDCGDITVKINVNERLIVHDVCVDDEFD